METICATPQISLQNPQQHRLVDVLLHPKWPSPHPEVFQQGEAAKSFQVVGDETIDWLRRGL